MDSRVRDAINIPVKKHLRRFADENAKNLGYKNEKYKPAYVDVNSFGNEQFHLHKKDSGNQRGVEYLTKLKSLLPSVFEEFKHDDLER